MFLFPKRLHSSQRTERTRKRLIFLSLVGIFLVAGTVAALSWGSYREEVTVNTVHIVGAEAVSEKDIRGVTDAELSGAYFKLFNRANSFLYPRKSIKETLSETFPRLASVSVSRRNLTELTVDVKERVPTYLWCGLTIPKDARHECYFLDAEGVTFARAPYFSGSVYFELYGKMEGGSIFQSHGHGSPVASLPAQAGEVESPIGLSFLPSGDFTRIIAFKDALIALGLPAEKLVIIEDTGDVSLFFASGLRLMFQMTQDFTVVLSNLRVAIGTEPLKKEFFYSAGGNPYEFLDARFENRIFYK